MQLKDLYLILSVVIIWGINFTVIKIGLFYTSPFLFGALRFVPFLPLLFFFKRPQIPFIAFLIYGLVYYFGQFSFLFVGMTLGMPAGMASMVLQSQAFFTILFAQFVLAESFRIRCLIGLVISAIGLLVISIQDDASITLSGLIFTLMAAACWALGNIIVKRYSKADIMSLNVWGGVITIIPFLISAVIIDGPEILLSTWQNADWLFVFSIIYIFLLATVFGNFVWGKLMRKYSASYIAPFSLLVPIAGISAAALLVDEHLSLQDICGAIIVMFGLVVNVFGVKIYQLLRRKI